MPVLPLVGSISTVSPGLMRPGLLGVVDHGEADAVFHARSGVLALELGHHGSWQSGGYAVQPHQRGVSNDFSYIRGNTSPSFFSSFSGISPHQVKLIRDCQMKLKLG